MGLTPYVAALSGETRVGNLRWGTFLYEPLKVAFPSSITIKSPVPVGHRVKSQWKESALAELRRTTGGLEAVLDQLMASKTLDFQGFFDSQLKVSPSFNSMR